MIDDSKEVVLAYCGLVCSDCGAFTKGRCQGCHCDKPMNRGCKVKPCAQERNCGSCADCRGARGGSVEAATQGLPPGSAVPGDADGDGVLTVADALEALKMSVGLIPEDLVLDMDGDGSVTSSDARRILQSIP